MDILKTYGFTQYKLSDLKKLFKGNDVTADEETIRYVYLIFNQDECLYISSTDPAKMKSVLKTLQTQGSLLAKEINPDTLIYVKGFTDSETAIKGETEMREAIKPKYNSLAIFHGFFASLKTAEPDEDGDMNSNIDQNP